MSTECNWICTNPKCGIEVQPVCGGIDRTFIAKIQTRVCASCKHVEDYKIGVVSDPTHQTFTEAELASHENIEPKCSNCGGDTVAWDLTCPLCCSPMQRGGRFEYVEILSD